MYTQMHRTAPEPFLRRRQRRPQGKRSDKLRERVQAERMRLREAAWNDPALQQEMCALPAVLRRPKSAAAQLEQPRGGRKRPTRRQAWGCVLENVSTTTTTTTLDTSHRRVRTRKQGNLGATPSSSGEGEDVEPPMAESLMVTPTPPPPPPPPPLSCDVDSVSPWQDTEVTVRPQTVGSSFHGRARPWSAVGGSLVQRHPRVRRFFLSQSGSTPTSSPGKSRGGVAAGRASASGERGSAQRACMFALLSLSLFLSLSLSRLLLPRHSPRMVTGSGVVLCGFQWPC